MCQLSWATAYNPGEVGAGAGDGVCDFVDPGESNLGFLGTSSERSLTSFSWLRLFSAIRSFEVELLLPLLCKVGVDWNRKFIVNVVL